MARLTRVRQKVFASNASNNGVFGSLQAGNPTTSNDVATLQSLSAFENGWDDAAYSGDKLPPLEEFQGIQYGISYQQAYMLQEGIAEWEASTPYYKGSLVKTISGTSFKLYCSLADNNTGNVVTNTTYWKLVMDSDSGYAILNANQTFTGNNTFSGTTAAVTQSASDNSTKVATTAYVQSRVCTTPATTTSTASANAPAYIVENYRDTSTGEWYRVWSDGWIEQGYSGSSSTTVSTYTFLKPFSDDNYTLVLGGITINQYHSNKTANGFKYNANGAGDRCWYACGY